MKILSLKEEAFGLDISDLSLKIANLKRKGSSLKPASFGEIEMEPGIVKNGEVKNEKRLALAIKQALNNVQGEKIKTKYVVASLPEEKAFLEVIQMPRMPEEDLKAAVIYEAENYIPLPVEDVYLDSQIVPPIYNHLDHFDVLIAALPKKIVDGYLFSLKEAGLKPVALEIESQSIVRALVKNQIAPSPVFIIDLGKTRTSIAVFSGYSLRFTSSIPVSSGGFTEIISKALKVDIKEAERLKIKYGILPKDSKGKDVFDALIPALVDLSEQIRRCLEYYRTHASHEHLGSNTERKIDVLLCGGGANMKGLASYLSTSLQLPVCLGNPWVNILGPEKTNEILPIEKSLRYTTALGLALRGINLEKEE